MSYSDIRPEVTRANVVAKKQDAHAKRVREDLDEVLSVIQRRSEAETSITFWADRRNAREIKQELERREFFVSVEDDGASPEDGVRLCIAWPEKWPIEEVVCHRVDEAAFLQNENKPLEVPTVHTTFDLLDSLEAQSSTPKATCQTCYGVGQLYVWPEQRPCMACGGNGTEKLP